MVAIPQEEEELLTDDTELILLTLETELSDPVLESELESELESDELSDERLLLLLLLLFALFILLQLLLLPRNGQTSPRRLRCSIR